MLNCIFCLFDVFNSDLNTSSASQANTQEQFKYDGNYFHFSHLSMRCAAFLSILIFIFLIFVIFDCADDAQNEIPDVFTDETDENGIYFFFFL